MLSNGFCCNSPEALRKCASILCSSVPYPMPGRISVDKKSRLTEVACTGLSYLPSCGCQLDANSTSPCRFNLPDHQVLYSPGAHHPGLQEADHSWHRGSRLGVMHPMLVSKLSRCNHFPAPLREPRLSVLCLGILGYLGVIFTTTGP